MHLKKFLYLKNNMKKNKYYISIIYTFLLFINSSVFAEEKCIIDSSPPEELLTYIKDSIKITNNIKSLVKKETKALKTDRIWAELIRWYNSIISHSNYINEFKFFLYEPIFNEIPYQIMRDDKIMANEIKRLDKFYYSLAKNWYYNILLKKNEEICKWVSDKDNCSFIKDKIKWKKAWDIILDIINNTRKIRTLMQNASMNKWDAINLLIVNDDFPWIIYKDYSEAKEGCSWKEWWFLKQVTTKINNIWNNTKYADKWVKAWEEAWTLLLWTDKESLNQYAATEKKLLKKELSKQWLNWSQTDAIMWNLDDFNSWWGWYDYSTNPISNSFEAINNSINDNLDGFTDSISKNFQSDSDKAVSISSIQWVKTVIEDQNIIEKNIITKYKEKLPLTATQDLNTNRINTQLINMHTNIWISINILDETCPISEIVCKSQWANLWWLCDCAN